MPLKYHVFENIMENHKKVKKKRMVLLHDYQIKGNDV